MLDLPLKGVLLVSDMDGTLIGSDGQIPRRNREAVERFVNKGGFFCVATGRGNASTRRYLEQMTVNAPCITCNGAVIHDFCTEKNLYTRCLPETAQKDLAVYIEAFPDVALEIYCGETIYVVNMNETAVRHLTYEQLAYTQAELAEVPRQMIKFLFAAPHERIMQVHDFAQEHPMKGVEFHHSSPKYFEGLPEGVTKGTTVGVLAEMLSVDPRMVMGIGDYYNDLDMIRSVAVSAVPIEAPNELKAIAGLVVGSYVQGAVADFIEYIEQHVS